MILQITSVFHISDFHENGLSMKKNLFLAALALVSCSRLVAQWTEVTHNSPTANHSIRTLSSAAAA